MKSLRLSIILPVYKEQDNISAVLRGIKKNVKTSHEIIIVPHSKDDPTIPVARKIKRDNEEYIKIINNKYGFGLANQLKTGLENSRSNIIAIMMADLSDDPKDLDVMVKKIDEGFDLVCASRYMTGGERKGAPLIKGFLSRFACVSLYILTGLPTRDATNAFKCFRRSFINSIKIESVRGFELPLELAVKAYQLDLRIGEVPTKWRERLSGKSKFKLKECIPYYLRWYIKPFKKRYLKI